MPMFSVESYVAGKRVFAVTSAFSSQNSVNLCPASFCIPRSNLPVSRWLLTSYFCILVPYDEKHIFSALQNLWHSDKEMPAQNVTLLSYVLHAQSLSHVWLFVTPWTVACQVPLCMEFSRQEYWSGLPFPSSGNLPDPGIKPASPTL